MDYKGLDLNFVQNVNTDKKVVDLLLIGSIGQTINGNDFAKEISYFSDFNEIRININSVGGSIFQGKSITAAMNIARSKGVKISTINRGYADSMAGIILANGDKGSRVSMDFATAMVHEPLIQDPSTGKTTKIVDVKNKETKDKLLQEKQSLLIELSQNTGKSVEDLNLIMSNDTRLDASGLLENGFVDTIQKTDNKPILNESMTTHELMVACTQDFNYKPKKMNLVTDILNLNQDAKDESIVASIKDLQNKSLRVDELDAKINDLTTELENKTSELENLKEEVKESKQKEIEAFVDMTIKDGKYSKDSRETLIVNASENFEMFKTLTNTIKTNFVDVTEMINKSDDTGSSKNQKMIDEYLKYDRDGKLNDLKNKLGDEKYNTYENAYINSLK